MFIEQAFTRHIPFSMKDPHQATDTSDSFSTVAKVSIAAAER
jgi:hypothetical protein